MSEKLISYSLSEGPICWYQHSAVRGDRARGFLTRWDCSCSLGNNPEEVPNRTQ